MKPGENQTEKPTAGRHRSRLFLHHERSLKMGSACLPQQALLESHIIEKEFQLQANNDQVGINSIRDPIVSLK
jgi:hypothetical protein